ncbi:MAG: flagellar hook associated protein, partial [Lachnospiraceae bacterium]|nr:flagellar hook associated protein [Lachnospiraceae bacterium]
MVIQHNISAVNSYRQLNTNQNALSKNLEKLSSGYRINRAADDAAGLAISESMRSKINGLDQAEANANDAIGLIQTEEGALTETHSMLQRMTTLATQAANGTYSDTAGTEGKTARDSIQKEVDELAE